MAKLVIRSGHNPGTEYALKDARAVLGRRSQSDVPVSDAKASREHAVVHEVQGHYFVQDLSRNGTLVNDQPALKTEPGTPFKYGDILRIGDTTYELVDEKSEPITVDIPGYTILEKVGSGGMGAVYKARQLSMDRIVALKILNERYSNNAEFVDRFIREARAAGKLNHPNVIHVHDISRSNDRHYFSMEFIDGPSVRELLKKEKRIEVNKALDIVLQAGKALEFAHENRIVHRDIKPDNIMLTREGIVKIADLGIAKTFDENPTASKDRHVLGTPHYMAPEQALGKAIDHRADIYSLGATFYHMVTGHTPFSGTSPQEILKAHVSASLPPIQELNKDVPDPVCFVIERMMAKLPEKRYANMSRLIEDIGRVQSGRVKGIERIEAEETSVLRAVTGKQLAKSDKGALRKSMTQVRTRIHRDELATGRQDAVGIIMKALFWLGLLIAAVLAIIYLPKYLSTPSADPRTVKKAKSALPSTPESHSLMLEARSALEAQDFPHAQQVLQELHRKAPDTQEGEDALNMLSELTHTTGTTVNPAAPGGEAALAEAKKFEEANAADKSGILAKYKAVLALPGNAPAVYAAAKAKVDQLEADTSVVIKAVGTQSTASAGAKETFAKAGALAASGDFDGARKLINDFRDASQSLEEGAEARKLTAKVNEQAKAKVQEYKDATSKMSALAAAAEWAKYSATVKDSMNADEVKPIIEDLEEKTQTVAMEELGKVTDKARTNAYADAISAAQDMQKKWAGMKWATMAKLKESGFKKQKALYETFLKSLRDKSAAAPVPLPFPLQTKIKNQTKWQVTGVRDDAISLDAVPAASAPGINVKLAELSPKEQYQLVLFSLPKEPTAEEHVALKLFCIERGLSDEADKHAKKAEEMGAK